MLKSSLHRTLILAFALSVIVPVATVTFVTTGQARNQAREAFIQSVDGEVQQIDRAFTLLFDTVEQDLGFLAEHASVQAGLGTIPRYLTSDSEQMLSPHMMEPTAKALYELFTDFAATHPHLAYIYLGDNTGGYLQWPSGSITRRYDPRPRPWYLSALAANGQPFLTNAYYWAADEQTTFSTVRKIGGINGVPEGVVGMDLSVDYLISVARDVAYGETGYLMIVENNNNILIDAGNPENNFQQLSEAKNGTYATLATASDGMSNITISGKVYLAKVHTSPKLGWRYIGFIEKSEVEAASDALTGSILKVTLISVLFFGMVAVYISSSIAGRIRRQHNQLKKARNEAEEASEAKSNFLSTMSHEIRTPLNGIIGMAQFLSETKLDREQKQQTKTILSSGETLLAIINDILDMGKIEAGAIELEEISFSLQELVSSALSPLALLASDKGVELKSTPLPDKLEYLLGDPVRLRQILYNLVSNAIKFTKQGSITVTFVCSEETAGPDSPSKTIWLDMSVRDTGIGIAEGRLEHIFDPFSQEDSTITRKYGGTGLGLSIVKQIVDLMDGRINIESQVGEGTCIQVKLPFKLAQPEDIEPLEEIAAPQATEASAVDGPNVLVAEDNPINATIATRILEKVGCTVSHAENGEIAVSMFRQHTPDLIFMDIHMPEKDGLAATKEIRSLPEGKEIPIIGLTADAFEDNHEKYRSAGMDKVLTKPIKIAQIQETVQHYTAKG